MLGHKHAEYHSVVPHPELVTSDNSWHQAKANAERERVLARLRDNNTKDRFYISNPNKNWGENELRKPKFHKHPERLHGGVMTSKAGQQWGFNRLKERVNELNIRASAAFGTEANQAQPSKLPGTTGAEDAINTAMTALYDGVQAVEYTGFVTNANKVLQALYANGSTIGPRSISNYIDNAEDIKRDLVMTLDQPGNIIGDDEGYDRSINAKKRIIKTAIPVMDRILRLLDLMAKTANLSEPERKQAIDSSKGRDLAEAKTRYDNTPAWSPAQLYNTGEYRRSVTGFAQNQGEESDRTAIPGRNPADMPLQQVQGQRQLGPTSGLATTVEQAVRYNPFGAEGTAESGSPRSEGDSWASPPPSINSSQAAIQAMRPGFYEAPGPAGRGRRKHGKKGGCGECQEGEPLTGAGPGDGPLDTLGAKEAFKQDMGRYPKDNEELLAWMKKKNGENPNHDPADSAELPPTGAGRKKPMDARARRLAGRGKPRDTEASRILKMLNDAEDEGMVGGAKKKNTFRT
jgi:hypothetical protein